MPNFTKSQTQAIQLQDKNILDYSDDAYLELINNNIESNNTKKVYKLLMEYKKKYQNYL